MTDEIKPGAHHLTPENIAAVVADLEACAEGTETVSVMDRDWRTQSGILAKIIRHLAARSVADAGDAVTGWQVSLDVSTGDHDATHRLFGIVESWQESVTGPVLLAVETSRSFDRATPSARTLDDLAALIQRLVRALRKAAPEHDLPAQALDYLKRLDLLGSPLRSTPAVAPSVRDQALEAAAALCDAKYRARVASGHPREASTAIRLAEEIRALQGKPEAMQSTGNKPLDAQISLWRKEVARLNDLIEHATNGPDAV